VRRFDLRFAVGTPNGLRSHQWRLWAKRGQVYLAVGKMGRIEKFSFHDGNVCRHAFTSEYGAPAGRSNRAMHEWRRPATPAPGVPKASCPLMVGFPTDYLSTALEQPVDKPTTWIEAARPGQMVVVSSLFTRETRAAFAKLIGEGNQELICYVELGDEEAFALVSHVEDSAAAENFRVLAGHGEARDLVIWDRDPEGSGRPVRIIRFTSPQDGDAMQALEQGGYYVPAGTSIEGFSSRGTLIRNLVLARQWSGSISGRPL
jgi:hypothetical protein